MPVPMGVHHDEVGPVKGRDGAAQERGRRLRIAHVAPSVTAIGGLEYSVPRLCMRLAARNHRVELLSQATKPIQGVEIDAFKVISVFEPFKVSAGLPLKVKRVSERSDVVHAHGVWTMVSISAGLVAPGRRAKFVMSVRGGVSPWTLGHRRAIKRCLWPFQRKGLARADLLHVASAREYRWVRAVGLMAPVAVVPNAVDVPRNVPAGTSAESSTKTLLFLSRIHPVKGLDRLLESWKSIQETHRDWRLVVVGPGRHPYVKRMRALATRLELERIEFKGPLYGDEKARAYYEADLFVLPTNGENFGIVVAEALAHGCPCVVSKKAPWQGLVRHQAGWWVDHDLPELTRTLAEAMALPDSTRSEMGRRGRDWIRRDFGWTPVVDKMEASYRWLLEGGEAPEWVVLD